MFLHKIPYIPLAQVSRNIHFLPHSNQFSQRMRCTIFQRNANLLVIHQDIISHMRLLYLEKNWRSSLQMFSETIIFFPYFHHFKKWVRFLIFEIDADFKINQLKNFFYTRQLTLLKVVFSIAEGFRKVDFLPHFYLISQRMRCAIFQINTDLVKVYEHINIFKQETL